VGASHPLWGLAPPTVEAPNALAHHAGQRRTARRLRLSLSLSAQAAHVHRVWVRQGVKERVVFHKWRSVEIDGTLGLVSTASQRKEWPMTCIAVQCPHCQSEQIVRRGKMARGTQRYLCQNTLCAQAFFLLDSCNRGCLPEVKQTSINMSLNASGVRDHAQSAWCARPSAFRNRYRCTTSSLASLSTAMPLDGQCERDHLHF
jgi:transposase-like protein